MERGNVFERVKTIIAGVLELDKAEIDLDSSLVDDLGIESVDLIDISAKIEEEFDIEIAEGELWNFDGILTDGGNMKEGKITKQGVKHLFERFPGDDFRGVKPGTTIADMLGSIKVKFIVNYLCRQTV